MKNYTVHFGNHYRQALHNYATGKFHDVPHSWLLAFKHVRKGDMTTYINFALGMTSHIVCDLGIAISELDPTGTNATAKKSDSEKINGIIQHCSKELVLALVNFYAPIIDLTQWITLLNLVLDEVIVIIRDIAWNEAIFICQ
ncbi:unnamed protein product [Rotaria sp. Silwood2]|nr:unnamed protein product [Rotaria sp. Silwood2]CAF3073555.1 unnamed protein product [Rotaria sp. Silwood2]CAF4316210.1 unnamed protein product [Rotaria sp. Silwood2]